MARATAFAVAILVHSVIFNQRLDKPSPLVMNQQSYTLLEPDTRNPSAVAGVIEELHQRLFPGARAPYVRPVMQKIEQAFAGRWRDYQAMDTAYHDLEHTLQATLCCLRILSGHQRANGHPTLAPRNFSMAFHAMLLHDIGYLKKRDDQEGTGAKYTLIHEPRGCDIAHEFLAEENWAPDDIERACSLILCTGPRSNLGGTKFGDPTHRLLAQAVCTADFLSQMSDPGYLQKLPDLFEEFVESDRSNNIPADQQQFKTLGDLYRNTPTFWEKFVMPKLQHECGNIGRYLADPFPDGPNPYFDQVQANIAAIRRIVSISQGSLTHLAKHLG
jgi:hypothetical protein